MEADRKYHPVNYDAAVKAYEGEAPRLTREKVAEFFTNLSLGGVVGLINKGTPTQPMTAILFTNETVSLWPRSPHFVVDAIGRYFDKDMKQCRKNNQKLLGYKRHFPIIIGMGLQFLPVTTALPDGGKGTSFLCRHFFIIHESEEKRLVSLSGLSVTYCCPSWLIRDKIQELVQLCRGLFVKEVFERGKAFSLAKSPVCGGCKLMGPCLDLYHEAHGA